MSESAVYRPHPEEPALATLRDEVATDLWAGLTAQHFELVSRGDFVSGVLYRGRPVDRDPESDSPLLLIQHATEGGAYSDYLACAAAWSKEGLAIASIDLPLHGARSSPKLSGRLVDGIRRLSQDEELDQDCWALVEEFARQTTSDLVRTLDALSALPGIDPNRLGFMGFGLGAIAGCYLLAHDPRLRALVLAGVGAGGPADFDARTYLDRARSTVPNSPAGREILVVAAKDDEHLSGKQVDALFEAAPEPREILRTKGCARALPKEILTKIEAFLRRTLEF